MVSVIASMVVVAVMGMVAVVVVSVVMVFACASWASFQTSVFS